MRKLKLVVALWALALLTACASFGLAPAKSFDDQVAYGYSTIASARQSATNALTTGSITVVDAQAVQAMADKARAGFDLARVTYKGGDVSTALGQLQVANQVLTDLALYMQSKGVK